MMRSFRNVALGTAALMLAACSTLTGTAPTGADDQTAWRRHQLDIMKLGDWSFSGRVGFIDGNDSGSGSLDWQQQEGLTTVDFRGPLGAGAVHMEGDASALHVRTSRGDDFVTMDPEEDLGRRLHQPLPVMSLRYWVLGVPDPGAESVEQSAGGELKSLDQRGWHVEYQEYAQVQGLALPVRLTLARDAVHIKVAVSSWSLPPSGP
ncbi:MAG TPA: lipoprotein insertase outer membrane protein LolB [Gammaproteobacteria bacterium]|nr:lipoprotein insertase outer membrane protein LolB [Gammaproteobacteria bacterium]